MRGTGAVILVLAVTAGLTAGEPDALLNRIRERARANLDQMPDYICLQTVERTHREPRSEIFLPVDTIRVEVGLFEDRELVAWPEASSFADNQLADFVQQGTIGSGNFALHARNVLVSSSPEFTRRGDEQLRGRQSIRYDYVVPVERSTYYLRVPPLQARVRFHGSFWADAGTLDLMRLVVVADEVPSGLGLAEARSRLDYTRRPIGEADFLLPEAAELSMTGADGVVDRNVTRFSSCRQYVGESSIRYAGEGEVENPAEATALSIPPYVSLALTLDSAINPGQAAIGDPIEAILEKPLRVGEKILVPKGAVARGRLVRLETYDQPYHHFVIGLVFDSLEFGGRRAAFHATMRKASGSRALMQPSKRLDPTFQKKRKAFLQVLATGNPSGQGILHWRANRPIVQPGLKMIWETEPEH